MWGKPGTIYFYFFFKVDQKIWFDKLLWLTPRLMPILFFLGLGRHMQRRNTRAELSEVRQLNMSTKCGIRGTNKMLAQYFLGERIWSISGYSFGNNPNWRRVIYIHNFVMLVIIAAMWKNGREVIELFTLLVCVKSKHKAISWCVQCIQILVSICMNAWTDCSSHHIF